MNRISKLLLTVAACTICAAPLAAQELTGTLKKIKDPGVVKIGHREASSPFSYQDDKQQVVGYGTDICLKIVAAIKAQLKLPKLKVEFVPVTSQTRIRFFPAGTSTREG